ncbi:MAG TPA: thioesterase domain-containing protein, partial [Thermoleophilaceae bacterium]
ARRLGDRAAPPVHLFVAAHVAPHLHGDVPATHLLPRDELVARLGAMGGTPSAVLDNTALMDHFLPIVRADLGLCADYVYDPTAGRFLTIPISAFGATSDPEVPVCAIGPWADLTRGPFRLRLIPGNHFFAARAPEQLMRAIEHDLASRVPCG